MDGLALAFLILIMPLAVAGQNIGGGVIGLLLIISIARRYRTMEWAIFRKKFHIPIALASAYLLVLILSTACNPENPDRWNFHAVGGHLLWAFLPAVVWLALAAPSPNQWRQLGWVLAVASAFMGVMACTQAIWGWHLAGAGIVEGVRRAQGLYSHPLSFAYVCLLLFAFGASAAGIWPRHPVPWLIAVSSFVGVIASQSRTVEVICAGLIAWNVVLATKGRVRWGVLGLGLVLASGVLFTDNHIGAKMRGTLERRDVFSDYPDDRLAFWHANFNMVKERPLLGHGENLVTSYRVRFYDDIGLRIFIRKYEAHNMYLQWAVNGGLIGLGIMLAWVVWHWRLIISATSSGQVGGRIAMQVLIAFLLGGVTQNAFQDSTVRFTLAVAVACLWLATAPASEKIGIGRKT